MDIIAKLGLVCLALAGCAGPKPSTERNGDTPIYGIIGWTEPMTEQDALAMMTKTCTERGLVAKPQDTIRKDTTNLSFYECDR